MRCIPAEGIADKELSALLAREHHVPIVQGTTHALREVSPMLASKPLSTKEDQMATVSTKLKELVAISNAIAGASAN